MSRYHSPPPADDEDEPYEDNVRPDAAYYQRKYTSNAKFARQQPRDVTWISHTSRSRHPSQSHPPSEPTGLHRSGATRRRSWSQGRGRNQNQSRSRSRSGGGGRARRRATPDPDEEEYMNVDPYELFSGQSPQSPTTPVDWQAVGPRRRGVGGFVTGLRRLPSRILKTRNSRRQLHHEEVEGGLFDTGEPGEALPRYQSPVIPAPANIMDQVQEEPEPETERDPRLGLLNVRTPSVRSRSRSRVTRRSEVSTFDRPRTPSVPGSPPRIPAPSGDSDIAEGNLTRTNSIAAPPSRNQGRESGYAGSRSLSGGGSVHINDESHIPTQHLGSDLPRPTAPSHPTGHSFPSRALSQTPLPPSEPQSFPPMQSKPDTSHHPPSQSNKSRSSTSFTLSQLFKSIYSLPFKSRRVTSSYFPAERWRARYRPRSLYGGTGVGWYLPKGGRGNRSDREILKDMGLFSPSRRKQPTRVADGEGRMAHGWDERMDQERWMRIKTGQKVAQSWYPNLGRVRGHGQRQPGIASPASGRGSRSRARPGEQPDYRMRTSRRISGSHRAYDPNTNYYQRRRRSSSSVSYTGHRSGNGRRKERRRRDGEYDQHGYAQRQEGYGYDGQRNGNGYASSQYGYPDQVQPVYFYPYGQAQVYNPNTQPTPRTRRRSRRGSVNRAQNGSSSRHRSHHSRTRNYNPELHTSPYRSPPRQPNHARPSPARSQGAYIIAPSRSGEPPPPPIELAPPPGETGNGIFYPHAMDRAPSIR